MDFPTFEVLKLPIEIRSIIWEIACGEPRTIELYLKNPPVYPDNVRESNPNSFFYTLRIQLKFGRNERPSSTVAVIPTIPPILHVCQESRAFGLKIYEKFRLGGYVNYNVDRIMISADVFHGLGRRNPSYLSYWWLPEGIAKPADLGVSRLKHVAFYFPTIFTTEEIELTVQRSIEITKDLGIELTQLDTITIIFDHRRKKGKCRKWVSRLSSITSKLHKIANDSIPDKIVSFSLKIERIPYEVRRVHQCRHGKEIFLCQRGIVCNNSYSLLGVI